MTETREPKNDSPADAGFSGEEGTAERSSPAKDFGSAVVIGAIAVAVIVMSLRLEVPGNAFTAPGLLPLITAVTLLLMAVTLAAQALRAGGARGFLAAVRAGYGRFLAGEEGGRASMLTGIVIGYVVLVGQIAFDWRIPTPLFVVQVSSYEVISFVTVAVLLKLYWRAPIWRCALISLLTVEALAAIFRYGFAIIMPESF